MLITTVDNKSILTPTSGYLRHGFTHTLNLYQGCAYGNSFCGAFCYVQHNLYVTKGRDWGSFLDRKRNLLEAYERDWRRLKEPRPGAPKPLNLFFSSSTDPYIPQESVWRQLPPLLELMLRFPPDKVVFQTHSDLIVRDLDLIRALAERTRVVVNITVETDIERFPPPFKPHAASPKKRIEALRLFKEAGLRTQATVSPLMPIADVSSFAEALSQAAHRVILDHYLVGDGSVGGWRTRKTELPQMLTASGFGEWTRLEKLNEVYEEFLRVMPKERVLLSEAGFNNLEDFPLFE